jgi:predicted DNA-binding transcriptional regulator YafY
LACLADEWYLIAYDLKREDLRQFAVSRISKPPSLTSEYFDREFDAEEYLSNRFNRFVGEKGKEYNIVVRFDSDTAPWILERQWHPKQKVTKHKNGTLTLSFPSPSLYEARRWVLQWGGSAMVLEPPELVKYVNDAARALLKNYK